MHTLRREGDDPSTGALRAVAGGPPNFDRNAARLERRRVLAELASHYTAQEKPAPEPIPVQQSAPTDKQRKERCCPACHGAGWVGKSFDAATQRLTRCPFCGGEGIQRIDP